MSPLLRSTLGWLGGMMVRPPRLAVMAKFPGEAARMLGTARSADEAEGIYIRAAYNRLMRLGMTPASTWWTTPVRGGR